ncbi:MAG: hypothetical protein ACM3VS_16460 [Candidatus Dadabacteria bacterium]
MLDLRNLDLEVLRSLYEVEKETLIRSLVHGVDWEETSEQRSRVAELSSVLYRKLNTSTSINPAEGSPRSSDSRYYDSSF